MTEHEVVVVGCGPAGNTLAYRLARAGRDVLLLEKESLPRVKVCGGGLSRKTLMELDYTLEPVTECTIDGALLAQGPEKVVDRSLPGIGVTVRREVLDEFMTARAVQAGASLEEACRFERYEHESSGIRVYTSRGAIRTRVLVGADGAYSRVRRQLSPTERLRMVPAIEALVYPPPEVLQALGRRAIFDLGAVSGGYAWMFPKGDHLNIGLYRYVKKPDNRNLKAVLLEWLRAHPLTRPFTENHVQAYSIPVGPPVERLAGRNVVLVGDAAGLAEGFFGEGIYNAVKSARLAADSVLGYLSEGKCLSEYDLKLKRMRLDLLCSRLTADVFYRLPPRMTGKLLRSPVMSVLFGGLIAGRTSPSGCLFYTTGLLPFWVFGSRTPSESLTSALDAPR